MVKTFLIMCDLIWDSTLGFHIHWKLWMTRLSYSSYYSLYKFFIFWHNLRLQCIKHKQMILGENHSFCTDNFSYSIWYIWSLHKIFDLNDLWWPQGDPTSQKSYIGIFHTQCTCIPLSSKVIESSTLGYI